MAKLRFADNIMLLYKMLRAAEKAAVDHAIRVAAEAEMNPGPK